MRLSVAVDAHVRRAGRLLPKGRHIRIHAAHDQHQRPLELICVLHGRVDQDVDSLPAQQAAGVEHHLTLRVEPKLRARVGP